MALGQLVPGVSNNELIRTTWGNFVVVELNQNSVKLNGLVPGASGPSATPQVMTGALYVRPGGGGPGVRVQNGSNTPAVQWESNAATPVRYGYIQATPTVLNIRSDGTGGVNIADLVASNVSKHNAGAWFGGNGGQITMIDTSAGGNNVYLGLYGNGSMTAPGTRNGYVGYGGTTALDVQNDISGGAVRLTTTGAGAIALSTPAAGAITLQTGGGDINFTPGTGGDVVFSPNHTYAGRLVGPRILWGKTVTNLAVVGVEMLGTGTGGGGIYSTASTAGAPNLYLRHEGATNANDEMFARFMAAGTEIGSITQNGSTGVHYNTTSDHRAKTVVGPIGDAVDRVKQLRPYRVTWNDDPNRGETDAFIAHEVEAVVPDAVHGTKDAELDGVPVLQSLDYSGLVTVSVAALQDLIGQVEALTARVAQLEGAAA